MSKILDQSKNYTAQFGLVFRSSAIFFIPRGVRTTITFSNYWKFKNNLDVVLAATVRDMDGNVCSREVITFESGLVENIDAFPVEEGSIEVEAFGNTNLRIPYAAIMAIYETDHSVSMVHSYGRNHSLIELEDGQALVDAHEGCWSVNTDPDVRNLAIFHCGHTGLDRQTAKLELIATDGTRHRVEFELEAHPAFATVTFDLDRLCPDFRDYLGPSGGWASLTFGNASSFTRLLILWQRKDGQLQATHSNFDYNRWGTNTLAPDMSAYMRVPEALSDCESLELTVYPNMLDGQYNVHGVEAGSRTFDDAINAIVPAGGGLTFERSDGPLPSRLVTGLRGRLDATVLPFECSLGVYHPQRPPKRFHWSPVSACLDCELHVEAFRDIYPHDGEVELVWRLYTPSSHDWTERKQSFASLADISARQTLTEIFPDAKDLLGDAPGYVSLFSHYGGFLLFSSVRKGASLSIEHSF